MMGGLRAFAQSIAGKAVLVLLAVLLLGSGIVGSISLFTSSRVSTGINAGGERINELEIATEARNAFFQIAQPFETQLGLPLTTAQQFDDFGLIASVKGTTEDRLVNQVAFQAQANQLGLTASDEELSAYVQSVFTDPVTGQFSERRMSNSLAYQGLTERAFLRETAAELASTRLFTVADDLVFDNETNTAIAPVPSAVALAEFNARWARYDIDYFAISPDAVEIPEPTNGQLQAILDETPVAYQRPEFRSFTGIFLTPADLIDSIEVTDEDIQVTYDEYVARAEVGTQWAYKQLSLDDGDLAQSIVDAVRGGQSFEEAAAAAGVATPNDVGLRPISYGREAINAAFTAATEVGMLDVVEDGGRFSLIEVYDIQAPEIPSFEDYRPTARLAIAGPQASAILSARFDELDGLVGTMSLEDAAAQVDLPVISGEMAQSGPDARVEGVPFNAKIIGEVFSAPVGQTGFRNSFGDDGLFILRVDGVEETRPLTFEEAEPRLRIAYTEATRRKLLTTLGEEAMITAANAEGFAAYAAEAGLTIETREGLTLADLLRFSVPTNAIDGAAAGDVVSGVTNTGFNIVLVQDARAADAEADADALAGIEAQFAFQYDDELQRAFREAVRDTVSININDLILDRAVTSGLNAYLDLRSGGDGQVRLEGRTYADQGGQNSAGM